MPATCAMPNEATPGCQTGATWAQELLAHASALGTNSGL